MSKQEIDVNAIKEEIAAKGFAGKLSVRMIQKHPKEMVEPLVMGGKTDSEIAREIGIGMATMNTLRRFYELPIATEVRAMLACVDDGDDELADTADTDEADELAVEEMKKGREQAGKDGRVLRGIIEQDEFVEMEDDEFESDGRAGYPESYKFELPVEDEDEDEDEGEGIKGDGEPVVRVLTKQEEIMRELDREANEIAVSEFKDEVRVRPLLDVKGSAKLAAPLVNGVAKYLDRMDKAQVVRVVVVVEV